MNFPAGPYTFPRPAARLGLLLGALAIWCAAPLSASDSKAARKEIHERYDTLFEMLREQADGFGVVLDVDGALLEGEDHRERVQLSEYSAISFLVQAERLEEARTRLEALQPRSDWSAPLFALEARLLQKLDEPDAALQSLEEAIERDPSFVDAYLSLSELHTQQGDLDASLGALERARAVVPRSHVVLEALSRHYGLVLRQAKSPESRSAAIEALEDVYLDLIEARPGVSSTPYLGILAWIEEDRGDLDGARSYIERAVEIDPRDTKQLLRLYDLRMRDNDVNGALEAMKRVVVLEPNNADALRALTRALPPPGPEERIPRLRGEELGDPEILVKTREILRTYAANSSVVGYFGKVAAEYPGRDDIQIQYAAILAVGGRLDVAEEVLRGTVGHHPHNAEAWFFLARLAAEQSKPDALTEAVEAFVRESAGSAASRLRALGLLRHFRHWDLALKQVEDMAETAPDSPDLPALRAEALAHLGRHEDALAILRAELAREPGQPALYPLFVRSLEATDHLAEAIAPLEAALESGGAEYEGFLRDMLVRVAMQARCYDKALEHAEKGLEKDPENVSLELARQQCFQEMGRVDEALRLAEAALDRSPDSVPMQLSRIQIYQESGRLEDALRCAREAVEASPDNWRLQLVLADLYEENEQPTRSGEVLESIASDFGDQPHVMHEVGLMRWNLEQFDGAEKCFRAVIEAAPDYAEAYNSLGYLYSERDANLDEALDLVRKALEMDPEAGHIIDSLGWVHFKRGEYDQAVENLERASQLEHRDPVVHEHLGEAYLRVGREAEALRAFQRSLELSTEEEDRDKIRGRIDSIQKAR